MKKKYIIFILLGIIGLIALLTNPNKERHKEVLKAKIMAYFQQAIKSNSKEPNSEVNRTGQTLGMMLDAAIIDAMLDNVLSTENYLIFSTTKITWDGKTKIIGIGAFGNVFLSSKFYNELNKITESK